jgi:hypothetical protein
MAWEKVDRFLLPIFIRKPQSSPLSVMDKIIGFGVNRKKSDLLKELSAVKKNIGIGYCFVRV